MAFLVSPGVNTSEIDLTTSVPSVGTSTGATVGVFRWGPANTIVQVSSESDLLQRFFAPNSTTAESFLSATNFLAYGNDLRVVRAINSTAGLTAANNALANTVNASGTNVPSFSGVVTVNVAQHSTTVTANTTNPQNNKFTLLTSGDSVTINGVLRTVAAVTDANTFTVNSNVGFSVAAAISDATLFANTGIARPDAFVTIANDEDYFNTHYGSSNGSVQFVARYPGELGNSLKVEVCAKESAFTGWMYAPLFDEAPNTSNYATVTHSAPNIKDELHIVVVDQDGLISGVANTVLERYSNLSKATDARGDDGSSIYYKEVLYRNSQWIYCFGHPHGSNVANTYGQTITAVKNSGDGKFFEPAAVSSFSLQNGADGIVTQSAITTGIGLFNNTEKVDISLLFAGDCGAGANASINTVTVANEYLSVATARKDCVAFVSPAYANVVGAQASATAIVNYRNALTSTSYGVMDSGWKYQYDKYNDVYRWIPGNADVAGLCVRTDLQRDPWFSPAGLNRGQIRNLVKLGLNPTQAERDTLYKGGVNPIVSFPGEGTVLFGDKTLQGRPSAFDRINVRRLFIVLEKAISIAARSSLFEYNDEFTRAQFVALVEPFLRDVQGRRGIFDFRVVCDESNNTAGVIDRNEFIGDIYVKPARSVNFIQLNFVAVRSGVAFDEIVGRF